MKRYKKICLAGLCVLALTAGCTSPADGNETVPTPSGTENNPATGNISDLNGSSSGTDANTGDTTANITILAGSDVFTERDLDASYTESKSILIQLNGNSASCSDKNVIIDGTTVTITTKGTYVLSGTLENGQIIVDAAETDKPQLVLTGASITSADSAALYIKTADKVFLTLADGTENTLANGGTFTATDENNIDGAVFSKQDLTLNGTGALTVTSPVGHGIVCKDDLVFTGGTYQLNTAGHGLDANDSVRLANAVLTIDTGKDGIHVENTEDTTKGFFYMANGTISAEAEGDGISAGAYINICDGSIHIVSGGGSENGTKTSSGGYGGFMGGFGGMGRPGSTSSATETDEDSTSSKGIKATGDIMISGGNITVDSADDSIHANANVTVNGGTFLLASGDDGIHADETLTINDGSIDISESYEGLEALDIKINGGDIKLKATDDGLNAAGGTDESGFGGTRGGDMFGGRGGKGGKGGMGGMGGMSAGNGSIEITGGTLYVNASGDGIDANGTLLISGGFTTVVGPTQGDTATLDYDSSATITGGTFIGTGASGMAQTFSASEQGVIAVNVGNQKAGTHITLADASGKEIVSYEPELSFAVVILSSPDIITGETYNITVGTASGSFTAN